MKRSSQPVVAQREAICQTAGPWYVTETGEVFQYRCTRAGIRLRNGVEIAEADCAPRCFATLVSAQCFAYLYKQTEFNLPQTVSLHAEWVAGVLAVPGYYL